MIDLTNVYEIRNVLNDKVIDKIEDEFGNIIYEAWKRLSGIPPLTLPKCKGVDLVDYKIYGNSVQEGTPTPEEPIEVENVGDKTSNLLNPDWLKRGTIPDSTGKPQDSTTRVYTNYLIPLEAGEYYIRMHDYNNLKLRIRGIHIYNYDTEEWESYTPWSNIQGKQFTISTLCKARFVFQTPQNDTITVEDVKNGNPLLVKGEPTEYEPYGYKIPVKVSGKNFFDKDNFTPGMTNGTRKNDGYNYTVTGNKGNEASASSGSFNVRFSKGIITPTKSITVSVYVTLLEYGDIGDKIRLWTVNGSVAKEHVFASETVSLGERLRLSWTYTNIDYEINALWFYVNGNKLLFEMDTLQIEVNDVMTDFEPYVEPITTNIYLNEPLRKVGDYADYIDFKNQKVYRNVQVLDDTGTLTIEESYKGVVDDVGTDMDLPNIATFKGTTIIEVDTTIQPSNMEVQYYGKGV